MPTPIEAITNDVRQWTNFDHDDATIHSWVKMAEERINEELRHRDMIVRATNLVIGDSSPLPADWLGFTYVRKTGGKPFTLVSEDDYWRLRESGVSNERFYTIIGNELMVYPAGDSTDGMEIEIAYYAKVPSLQDGENWLYTKHYRLYLFATCALSAPHDREDERITVWEGEASRLISMMNLSSGIAKYSGSPLKPRRKGFG